MTHPTRASRRAVLLGAAAAVIGGFASRTSAGPSTASSLSSAAIPVPIEQSASVAKARPARRLRRTGSLLFPMGSLPRCAILDNFGEPRGNGTRIHEGIDILATEGQEVYAVADGKLVNQTGADASLSGNSWGLTAIDGTYYFYAHLSRFADGLKVGDSVRRNQVIGYVGDTGNPGPGNYHLHFEVHPGGIRQPAVDPLPLLEVPFVCSIS